MPSAPWAKNSRISAPPRPKNFWMMADCSPGSPISAMRPIIFSSAWSVSPMVLGSSPRDSNSFAEAPPFWASSSVRLKNAIPVARASMLVLDCSAAYFSSPSLSAAMPVCFESALMRSSMSITARDMATNAATPAAVPAAAAVKPVRTACPKRKAADSLRSISLAALPTPSSSLARLLT